MTLAAAPVVVALVLAQQKFAADSAGPAESGDRRGVAQRLLELLTAICAAPIAQPDRPTATGGRGRRSLLADGRTEADAKAVAGVGVARARQPQTDGAAGIAGDVEIVAAAADRPRVLIDDRTAPHGPLGVEVIEDHFPHAPAHVGHAEAVAALLAVMVDRRDEREPVAPRCSPAATSGSGREADRGRRY